MDVSVVVPALNEEKRIQQCLCAIRSQNTKLKYEIIVCDGNSRDKTVKIAEEYADRVVISKQGLAFQRNTGANEGTGKYILFVDADTLILPDYFKNAMQKFRSEKNLVGLTAGFVFSKRIPKLIVAENVTNLYYTIRDKLGIGVLLGFDLMVQRKAFEKVNGFRPVPLEDWDLSYRLKKFGKIRYYTNFYVVTSSRRLESAGVWGTTKYYLDLFLSLKNIRRKDFVYKISEQR